jgi:hypothetical protein
MKRIFTLLALVCLSGPAFAQDGMLDRIAALEAKMAALDQVKSDIAALKADVAAIKAKVGSAAPFVPVPTGQCSPTCSAQYGTVTGMTCGPNGCSPTYAPPTYYSSYPYGYTYAAPMYYMSDGSCGTGGSGGCGTGRGLFGRRR